MNEAATTPSLQIAGPSQMDVLLPLVRAYHEFEQVEMTDTRRIEALLPLLRSDQSLGGIWLVRLDSRLVGYIALCFGYSIEFEGRDAFIDELYLIEEARGRGVGRQVLNLIKPEAMALGIVALHLEVARTNDRAKRLYANAGFESRERFHMMSCRLTR